MFQSKIVNSFIDKFITTRLHRIFFLRVSDALSLDIYYGKKFDNLYDKGHGIIHSSDFYIFGNNHIIDGFKNIKNKLPSLEQEYIHSFEWMLHLRSVGTIEAQKKALELLLSWINNVSLSENSSAYALNVVSKRLFNLILCHGFLDLQGENRRVFNLFFNKQVKHLFNWHHLYKMDSKVKVHKALFALSVLCKNYKPLRQHFLQLFVKDVKAQIAHDGGHVSRNPELALDMLHDIIAIYDMTKMEGGDAVCSSILRDFMDKIASFIRTLRHSDGTLCVFNGGEESSRYKVNFLLSLSHIPSNPFFYLKNSNYVALKSRTITAIMDVGECIPNYNSLMALELSFKNNKIITNLGHSRNLRLGHKNAIGRTNNSCIVLKDKDEIINMPIKRDIKIEKRTEDDWEKVTISYFGLEDEYGISYHKTIYISRGEEVCILGENLLNINKNASKKITEAYLRLHLHPSIDRIELYKQSKRILFPVGKEKYFFNSPDAKIKISKSYYFGREVYGEKCYTMDIPFVLDSSSTKIEWSIFSMDSFSGFYGSNL